MSKKQKKNLRRIILSIIVFAMSFLSENVTWSKIILQMVSYLIAGYDVILSAGRKILSGQIFDEEFLMTLATVGAVAMREIPEAAMVMILYQTGELFQGIAVGKSRKSIKALMKIKPDSATVLRDGEEIKLPLEKVEKGELILVLPGEKVALDGIIEEGETSFDSSSITGESIPVNVNEGDRAVSGMINIESPVKVRVTNVYAESTVAKILNLVETSSAYKSKSEKFITKFSRKYTPCVFTAALITALVPPIFFGQLFSVWVRRALVFLVVSCPCALVISVPLSFFGGIGAASKKGILIKGSNYLETLSKVDKIAFDKTGTLTEGDFSVSHINPIDIGKEELLEMAAYAESFSNHPLALSVVKAYGKEIDKNRVGNVVNVSGRGIKAMLDGEEILAGNRLLLSDNNIEVSESEEENTVIYISKNRKYVGNIVLEAEIKPEAEEAIVSLKKSGIKRVVMLTGDNEKAAAKVRKKLCIDEVYTKLLPQDKVKIAEKIKAEGSGALAFAGDGINDAPVLTCADVGIAMGALGSDAAVEAADVVIMNDSLQAVSEAVKISKKTMRIVRQNITFSLVVKFGVMLLSTIGFDNMYAAIFADVGVMILAVFNAMRMLVK